MPWFARLNELVLWRRFEQIATPEQLTLVRHLVGHAAPILDRIIETFPTYTLHSHVHAENVVDLTGKLLGEHVTDLSPLEAAFLVLSAYFHDIGMVFHAEEREQLQAEPDFPRFLRQYPDAYVAVRRNQAIPMEIAERYCRWSHGQRVFHHLNDLNDDTLKWGVLSIKPFLGYLCESHTLDCASLTDTQRFPTDYHGDSDLLFCALLLRLADILDFDNSRSPESVYRYLGLYQRKDPREEDSDVEWRKHLCSEGFLFPADGQRPEGYSLDFIAGPTHPAVEHDARQFLHTIEAELSKCRQLVQHCSKRWRSFSLPVKVSPRNIHSVNYKYGEYLFSLDKEKIVELFMGDTLYPDTAVFVRELIQNAFDTARHRAYYEECRGNADYEAHPVVITEWHDPSGYAWVRFDDFGMGMTEQIIRDYLLKVGRSYYCSSQFQADLLKYAEKQGTSFVPISRFGIGLLSCFIVGDRIEISTWHVPNSSDEHHPVRLSMAGLHEFYVLQTGHHTPEPMPSQKGPEFGYRTEYGTSIAVRVDPRKETRPFQLRPLS